MTRPISARTRADAIAICEQRHDPASMRFMIYETAVHVGASPNYTVNGAAYYLACDAWTAAGRDWLEASGILRDGWCPSGWDVVAKAVTP